MCGLMFEWISGHGGLDKMEELAKLKASLIYDVIDYSDDFYQYVNSNQLLQFFYDATV